ncbi:MAG: UDP-forming cellulose synthase catalytic subunit [Synechococcales bacterium]|nr:UDP-forming cellulose synthase catalytic subunit [Synechococcales bacterium]
MQQYSLAGRWTQFQQWLTHWLTRDWTGTFDYILHWLNRRQLWVLMGALGVFFVPLLVVRPSLPQQGLLALALIIVGRVIMELEERQSDRHTSEALHLFLVVLSGIATLRYLYYRTNYTLNLSDWLNGLFSLLLYVAELYAIITLFLAYFQTLKIRNRQPVDLAPVPVEQWPSVDIYIPTYNEDVEIVRKTVLGALATNYPSHKKQVYVLDDGRKYPERREQLQAMCDELDCTLLTRSNNDHAKAGNINTALDKTNGDLVLILDCDHIPAYSFLQETVGFFFDPRVALVQTPHWFYNPDPFERNLLTGGRVPVGNELFYKVLQKGNDYWNAAFFCGSAAVIRRNTLLKVGGIATETVTEDCHTSLRLHSLGYKTVYYDKIMVAGLAPEKFASYIGQQVRWARGMAQILRLENPLLNPRLRLSLPQRLCYFSATSHFFFGFPRLMYAIAPMLFLLFGITSVNGLGIETLFYAFPHIVLSMQTNHIPYKHVRFSFWNEIYEFALSFQAGIVTLLALINPKLGSFNVTDKGLVVYERSFDLESVRYLVIVGALTAASLLAVPFWLIFSPLDTQAVLINAMWGVFNFCLVSAACLVAFEQPQLRRAHRLPRELPVTIHGNDQSWSGKTVNISETGAQILLDDWPNVADEVRVELEGDYGARALMDAQIVRAIATDTLQALLAVDFINPSQVQQDDLAVVLYSDVKQWYSQTRTEADRPLESFRFIATSFRRVFQEFRPEIGVKVRQQVQAIAELYWEEWGGNLYLAALKEISHQELRVELEADTHLKIEVLEQTQPIIGLLIRPSATSPVAQSVLAQVQSIERLSTPVIPADPLPSEELRVQRLAIELTFPKSLEVQQRRKIRQLLRILK